MSDNGTGVQDDSVIYTYDYDIIDDIILSDNDIRARDEMEMTFKLVENILLASDRVLLLLTLLTIIYGVLSWCIIKKFCNYRNFVLINTILSNYILCSISVTNYLSITLNVWLEDNFIYVITYFTAARHHWLLIISYMFYLEFVKVFNADIQRRFLKSSFFGWGVSLITTLMYTLADYYDFFSHYFMVGCLLLPLMVNCVSYVIIVFALCRSFNSVNTASTTWRRLYIATIIFILSDVFMMSVYVMQLITPFLRREMILVSLILLYITALLADVFLVFLKSNRVLWYELYVNKIKPYVKRSLSTKSSSALPILDYVGVSLQSSQMQLNTSV